MNGETGTLERIDVTNDGKECSFTAKMDNGKEIRFDPRDYAQIDYGYAPSRSTRARGRPSISPRTWSRGWDSMPSMSS
jgi:hypothetical protein